MNPQSQGALQQQFPLSIKKKFWKKMIQSFLTSFIPLAIFLFPISFIMFWGNGTNKLPTSGNVTAFAIFIFVFIIIYAICLAFRGMYISAYIKRYYYDGGDDLVTIKKGVFAPAEIHIQYKKIQDVYVNQDIIDRILGLYDVHLASATVTSSIEAHMDGVGEASATGLKNFLLSKIKGDNIAPVPISPTTIPTSPSNAVNDTSASKVNLSEEISDKTYPISPKWFTLVIILKTISIFISLVLLTGVFILTSHINFLLYSLCVFVLSFIWSIVSVRLWKKNFSFSFTPEFIYVKIGVFSVNERHIPYNTIQDVTLNRGVIERLFGLSGVAIRNVSGVVGIPGQILDKSQKIIEILNSITKSKPSESTGL